MNSEMKPAEHDLMMLESRCHETQWNLGVRALYMGRVLALEPDGDSDGPVSPRLQNACHAVLIAADNYYEAVKAFRVARGLPVDEPLQDGSP